MANFDFILDNTLLFGYNRHASENSYEGSIYPFFVIEWQIPFGPSLKHVLYIIVAHIYIYYFEKAQSVPILYHF